MITGKTYDVLKFCALIAFPAVGTLYFTLASIWGLPAAEQVVGTIVAVDAFLGVCLQISSNRYNQQKYDGSMTVREDEGGKVYSLELYEDPELELEGKDELRFKVDKRKPTTRRRR